MDYLIILLQDTVKQELFQFMNFILPEYLDLFQLEPKIFTMPSIFTCRFFLSAVLIFSQTLGMAQRETVEMEVLRNRLINDALYVMAHAYSLPESHHYKEKYLLKGIIKGLEYWYDVNPECNNCLKNSDT